MNSQQTYIYESPDGGHTVYRRPAGGAPSDREIHQISDEKTGLYDQIKKNNLWSDIHRHAKKDVVLHRMLEEIEIYYHLKSQP